MRWLLSAVILVVIAAELIERALHLPLSREIAWVAMGLTAVLSLRAIGFREFYLLALATAMVGLLFHLSPDPPASLAVALEQATFLMVFIFLLGMLHEAASSSPSIAACGEYLTRQPAGRRYFALNVGTANLAVLFNVGVLSFLVPLIQQGIERATPGDALNPVREQRQVSAVLRGFAWTVIWSPTAVAPLAVAELIPGTNRGVWTLYGLILFATVLLVGAMEDRLRFRGVRPTNRVSVMPFPLRGAAGFLATATCLFGMTAAFVWLTGDTIIFGLLMSCPLMLTGWLAMQYGFPRSGALLRTFGRLKAIAGENLVNSAPVAITLGCSGFIGRAAAELVPAAEMAETLKLEAMPDFILLGCIPVALGMLSLLALSPIMTAVFFGSLFGALPSLPADPTLIALSISCGWAVSMTFSPFATVVLVIGRVGKIPGRKMTWSWNLAFTILSAAIVFPFFAILTGGK